jgi:hypothetical protein
VAVDLAGMAVIWTSPKIIRRVKTTIVVNFIHMVDPDEFYPGWYLADIISCVNFGLDCSFH